MPAKYRWLTASMGLGSLLLMAGCEQNNFQSLAPIAAEQLEVLLVGDELHEPDWVAEAVRLAVRRERELRDDHVVALVAGLLLWPLTSTGARPRVQTVIAIGMLLVTAVGVVRGIQHWQPSMQTQKQLLAELKPIVKKASGDELVVVIDHSGTYGTQFTFPLQYLGSASRVMNQDSTPVWLCFDSSDPYQIPGGGVECDPDDTGTDLRLQTVVHRPGGDVDIYLSRKDSDD